MTDDSVIRTAMKSCIHRHPTHPDQRPLRPPKLNIAVLAEVVLAASGASYQDGRVPMDATFDGGSNDIIGGRVRLRRPKISPVSPDLQKEQTSVVNIVYQHVKNLSAVLLSPDLQKEQTSVVNIVYQHVKNLSAVLLTPVNSYRRCR